MSKVISIRLNDELAGRLDQLASSVERPRARLIEQAIIRYINPEQVGHFDAGTSRACYATPTPYAADEAARYLLLPFPQIPREHAYVLDPARVSSIQGPLWVAAGRGIQYYLPEGFPTEAI